jgi:serine/threonine protein kinase
LENYLDFGSILAWTLRGSLPMSDDSREFMHRLLKRERETFWERLLAYEGLQKWAGFDPSQLTLLGQGANGYAWQINDRLVLKLTRDLTEALASTKVRGRRLSNVNRVYKVAQISNEVTKGLKDFYDVTIYAIVQAYLPGDLDDYEYGVVEVMDDLLYAYGESELGGFLNTPNWEDRKVRRDFLSFVDRFHGDSVRQLFKQKRAQDILMQLIKGLTSLRRAGVSYNDIKGDNVRKNAAGQFVIFDLGVSKTSDPNQMDIIERMLQRT